MAKKKVPSLEDAVTTFKEVMLRASLEDYRYVGKTMISTNDVGCGVIIAPNDLMWDTLIMSDVRDKMSEIGTTDIRDTRDREIIEMFTLNDTGWTDLEDMDALYKGQMVKVPVEGLSYDVFINRSLLPLKLKKAEYKDISFRVTAKVSFILSIKKKFSVETTDGVCEFTLVRMFNVL